MFGYQEILIISAIIVGALVVPRMVKPPRQAPRIARPRKKLTGAWRMAMAASLIYPLIMAAFMRPWRGDMFTFAYIGLGPVLIGWLLFWVFQGFKRR